MGSAAVSVGEQPLMVALLRYDPRPFTLTNITLPKVRDKGADAVIQSAPSTSSFVLYFPKGSQITGGRALRSTLVGNCSSTDSFSSRSQLHSESHVGGDRSW